MLVVNTLRLDPSRTAALRRAFAADILRRMAKLLEDIKQLIVEDDAFGLEEFGHLAFNAERQVWRFKTLDEKLKSFKRWLQHKINMGILETDATGKPWNAKYINSAYRKGAVRSYLEMHPELDRMSLDFYRGRQAQFLESSFAAPERAEKLKLLYTRAYEELRGVSDTMAHRMGRVLAQGLGEGKNPNDIARTMAREVGGMSRQRGRLIARTEIIYAHAEGQLDALEDSGVKNVTATVEYTTAEDDRVCSLCRPLNGVVMTIEEARGLIPRHPNCRCAWRPADIGEDESGQIRGTSAVRRQLRRSIQAERPYSAFADARALSRWAGKLLIKNK